MTDYFVAMCQNTDEPCPEYVGTVETMDEGWELLRAHVRSFFCANELAEAGLADDSWRGSHIYEISATGYAWRFIGGTEDEEGPWQLVLQRIST